MIDFEGKNKSFPYEDKAIEKRKKTQKICQISHRNIGNAVNEVKTIENRSKKTKIYRTSYCNIKYSTRDWKQTDIYLPN